MVINHIWGLFTNPKEQWQKIRDEQCSVARCFATHISVLAAIPAISAYIGTTMVGWETGFSRTHMLTPESAGMMAVMTYVVMLVGIFGMGNMIRWMGRTYGTDKSISQCVRLAAFTATPLFLIGLMLLYPIPWLNMLLGMPAVGYSVYLLYSGVPVMMEIPEERGFLFSSSVLGVGLVAMVAILAVTVLLWGFGFGPAFVS